MSRFIVDSLIILFLLLIGISIFVPSRTNQTSINTIITQMEQNVTSGNIIEDGVIEEINIGASKKANFIASANAKVSVFVVGGLNSLFELGLNILRKVIG